MSTFFGIMHTAHEQSYFCCTSQTVKNCDAISVEIFTRTNVPESLARRDTRSERRQWDFAVLRHVVYFLRIRNRTNFILRGERADDGFVRFARRDIEEEVWEYDRRVLKVKQARATATGIRFSVLS